MRGKEEGFSWSALHRNYLLVYIRRASVNKSGKMKVERIIDECSPAIYYSLLRNRVAQDNTGIRYIVIVMTYYIFLTFSAFDL